eukprot:4013740-Pyramimonas_sp.AAC.2
MQSRATHSYRFTVAGEKQGQPKSNQPGLHFETGAHLCCAHLPEHCSRENIPALPVSDWSVVRIYLCFLSSEQRHRPGGAGGAAPAHCRSRAPDTRGSGRGANEHQRGSQK